MNAVQQATSLTLAGKIASVVSLFRVHFPDGSADLNPWCSDHDTQSQVDPDSIDIGFHLPGWNSRWQCRSLLVQIRFHPETPSNSHKPRAIGIEIVGFDYRGERWRLSTIATWLLYGDAIPNPQRADELKLFCREALEIFNAS